MQQTTSYFTQKYQANMNSQQPQLNELFAQPFNLPPTNNKNSFIITHRPERVIFQYHQ